MWVPEVGIAELIIRGVIVYLVLFVLLRFIGKKHIGELSPFDLVVLLIISETVDGSLIGDDRGRPFINGRVDFSRDVGGLSN
jgi:uncharacterized membrane protein YcaP (DUF421 family)